MLCPCVGLGIHAGGSTRTKETIVQQTRPRRHSFSQGVLSLARRALLPPFFPGTSGKLCALRVPIAGGFRAAGCIVQQAAGGRPPSFNEPIRAVRQASSTSRSACSSLGLIWSLQGPPTPPALAPHCCPPPPIGRHRSGVGFVGGGWGNRPFDDLACPRKGTRTRPQGAARRRVLSPSRRRRPCLRWGGSVPRWPGLCCVQYELNPRDVASRRASRRSRWAIQTTPSPATQVR